ncbi:MAG TPA: biotin carboxylase N-terminal domain-containing protein [Gammaproteobacteria bacterium]|nr:biotin carboxylase N-terminal domain-containing protein [Gammaproteobacteria bacterium]
MFETVLIANRGEIACRIIDTCRRLGVRAVAIYSDVDRHARHVREADAAVPVGPAAPAKSYLSVEHILEAARQSGAEAVHPGYGFLSENPELARACDGAGLVFVGPRPETIELMGSKRAAKERMEAAGVPTVPGYHGDRQDPAQLAREADRIGYPLMIKAVAGGGGKGMRVVDHAGGFEEALEGARREARGAFGDDSVLLERRLMQPRHIEMQVFGDRQGNLVHLFERECSIQRRYQKIIEESPSPFMDEELRSAMADAALAAARAVDYLGAGTVEFIVDRERRFYFMEMNTRLQVEHPVTEAITGLDLVEWQLRVAAGEALPLAQEEIRSRGHAIEARLYAENPAQGFVPSGGPVDALCLPEPDAQVRVDSGIASGDRVSLVYDPMIAKLVVHDDDRPAAVARLRDCLGQTAVFGPVTNVDFLAAVAALPAFDRGEIDTGFVDTHLEALTAPEEPPALAWVLATAYLLRGQVREAAGRAATAPDPGSPWLRRDAWRLAGRARQVFYLADAGGEERQVLAHPRPDDGWQLGLQADDSHELNQPGGEGTLLVLRVDGRPRRCRVVAHARRLAVTLDGVRYPFRIADGAHGGGPVHEEADMLSPMPGRIVKVHVEAGRRVAAGTALLVLEAMKMEYTLRAPADGRVAAVRFAEGDVVEADEPLIEFHPDEDPGADAPRAGGETA